MKLWPSKKCCNADRTFETAMLERRRGKTPQFKRAKQIHHIRGEERFWHWSDQTDAIEERLHLG